MSKESELQVNVLIKSHHASAGTCEFTVTRDDSSNIIDDAMSLSGDVYGPLCKRSQTLPARAPLVTEIIDGTFAAHATIPDPTPWSPELPATYTVTVQLTSAANRSTTGNHHFGFKALETRSQSFYLNQRRFVPRIVQLDSSPEALDSLLDIVTEEHLCLAISHPTSALLKMASEQGCWIFIVLTGNESTQDVHNWSQYPACFGMLYSTDAVESNLIEIRDELALRTLVGQELRGGDTLANGFHFAVSRLEELSSIDSGACPVIVTQSDNRLSIENARRTCELLQRDATSHGDFAGYAILNPLSPREGSATGN